jgi:hypothetical protein
MQGIGWRNLKRDKADVNIAHWARMLTVQTLEADFEADRGNSQITSSRRRGRIYYMSTDIAALAS